MLCNIPVTCLFITGNLYFLITFTHLPAPTRFPCGSAGEESACNAGDLDLIPGFGRSPGEGKGYLLQYSGLENSMDGIVHYLIDIPPMMEVTEEFPLKKHEEDGIDVIDSSEYSNGGW